MTVAATGRADIAEYALRLGDDALVLAQRLSEWSFCAPELEEDIALTNIALDLLGQARHLLSIAGEYEGEGRDEDDLAFLRVERQFRNLRIVEQPNGDFAQTILRQLFYSTYQHLLYQELVNSRVEGLAALASKAVKEVAYHRDHALRWTLRLGDGTEESHRRMVRALHHLWPFTAELFESDDLVARLVEAGIAAQPSAMAGAWLPMVRDDLERATLRIPDPGPRRPTGGRRGLHGEALGHLLAEMQWLHRAYPRVTW